MRMEYMVFNIPSDCKFKSTTYILELKESRPHSTLPIQIPETFCGFFRRQELNWNQDFRLLMVISTLF